MNKLLLTLSLIGIGMLIGDSMDGSPDISIWLIETIKNYRE